MDALPINPTTNVNALVGAGLSGTSLDEFLQLRDEHAIKLGVAEKKAWSFIKELTEVEPKLVGSLAIGIHDLKSDIDFVLPIVPEKLEEVFNKLNAIAEFRGERSAKSESTRFLFSLRIDSELVDVNLMKPDDAEEFIACIAFAASTMTEEEKIDFAFRKHSYRTTLTQADFDVFKIEPYVRFCPNFVWEPDFVLRKKLGIELPK